ncbi:MAG: lysophospholipid acyltransferase family protein [Planctomycetia bacterium]|nr:lysophospholipid acyltransferase family protein [Planctomycetia bacterium]
MRDYLIYLVVRLFISIVQALPLEKAVAWGDVWAWLASDVFRIRGRLVAENLRFAFPEKSEEERHLIQHEMWRHLFRMVVETAFAERKIHLTNWKQYVELVREVPPLRAMYEGRPVIFATGHLGNFEFAGYVLGLIGIPAYTVARTLDNRYLDRYLGRFRRSSGQAIIPKDKAAPMLREAMQLGKSLAILTDQHAGKKGVKAISFGRVVSTHKVISILAQTYHAPVAISSSIRQERKPFHFVIEVSEFLEVTENPEFAGTKEMAQWYNDCMERLIRRNPEQYWWLHNRWREKS